MGYKRMVNKIIKVCAYTMIIVLFTYFYIRSKYEESELEKETGKIYAFVSIRDIESGSKIYHGDFEKKLVDKSIVPINTVFNKGDYKKSIARININKKTLLTDEMIINKTIHPDDRYQDFKNIEILSKVEKGEYIDVRYKDKAEDLVVLSKKEVLERNGKVIKLRTNEIERINYSKYENKKGKFYIVKYIDPFIKNDTYKK